MGLSRRNGYYLFDDFNMLLHRCTIARAFKQHHISRKISQKETLERSQLARNDHMLDILKLSDPQNQLCYLVESATNEHTCHRKHGWSAFETTPRAILSVKRSEKHSVLPCYDIIGIMACHIHQGAIDGPRFE